MKISKIEFENFRNFKEHGEIKCSTDGKVTIVYGKNGDGKTTLHHQPFMIGNRFKMLISSHQNHFFFPLL